MAPGTDPSGGDGVPIWPEVAVGASATVPGATDRPESGATHPGTTETLRTAAPTGRAGVGDEHRSVEHRSAEHHSDDAPSTRTGEDLVPVHGDWFDAGAGTRWHPVSPKLASLRHTVLVVAVAASTALLALFAYATGRSGAGVAVVVAGVLAVGVGWRMVGRNVAAWGYTERERDLVVRRGVLFRQLVVVPYGRMQFVDVQAGPLERAFGLATVQLHTAAASTDAHIPGLEPAEAARLRDRLASRGEAQSAGL